MWPVKLIVWLVSVNQFRHLVDVTPVSKMPSTEDTWRHIWEVFNAQSKMMAVSGQNMFCQNTTQAWRVGQKVMLGVWRAYVGTCMWIRCLRKQRGRRLPIFYFLFCVQISPVTLSPPEPHLPRQSIVFSRPWQLTIKSITVAGGGWPAILSTGPYNSQQE